MNNHPEGEAFSHLKHHILVLLEQAVMSIKEPLKTYCSIMSHKLAQVTQQAQELDPADLEQNSCARRKDFIGSKLAELNTLEARLSLALDTFSGPATFQMCILQWGHLHWC